MNCPTIQSGVIMINDVECFASRVCGLIPPDDFKCEHIDKCKMIANAIGNRIVEKCFPDVLKKLKEFENTGEL